MKRNFLTAVMMTVLTGGGLVAAQTGQPPKSTTPAPASKGAMPSGEHSMAGGAPAPTGGGMGCSMMAGGMMGGGMMGGAMMGGGMCPMMLGGVGTKVEVKKLDKGVTITLTSSDAATVVRLQKMAEAMRLMHEATAP